MSVFQLTVRVLLLSSVFTVSALSKPRDVVKIRVPQNESDLDVRHNYDHQIIQMLLRKTEAEYGPFELSLAPRMNQFRALNALINGSILDIMVSTSNLEREKLLIPVPYSIHKGLMGIRIPLIKKERAADFARIKTAAELKRMSAGQGADWTDVPVLRANGFNVVTGQDYEGLFKMLAANRFDYFPRAVAEIFQEVKARPEAGFIVEETLALVYSQPAYIFVNKGAPELAARLQKGWEIALRDGTFEAMFRRQHEDSLRQANLLNRRLIFLDNPMSSEKDPDYSVLYQTF